MAITSYATRSTWCSSCIQRITGTDISQLCFPFYRQLRGKKKSVIRSTTINVKLLEDITGFGRKGSICPVEPGRMRNSWYPRQWAEYMTMPTAGGLNPQKIVAERDFTFGMKATEEEPKPGNDTKTDGVLGVKSKLLLAQKASEIMETSLPLNIIFYRTPISNPESEAPIQERPSQTRRAASSAAAELEAASEPVPKPVQPPLAHIFGSVSTTDIAESIKSLLSGTSEGSKIVIGPEDITIIQDENEEFAHQDKGIEGDRLKVLGDFQVEVRVKGAEAAIRRTVKVLVPARN